MKRNGRSITFMNSLVLFLLLLLLPGIISVDFDGTGQFLIIHSAFVEYLRKNENTTSSASAIYRLQESL
jgi:multisubunit Na+/H+ antiporter MnhE subunit